MMVVTRVGAVGARPQSSRVVLRCARLRNATVLHDDSCGEFQRAPGSDDDL